MFSFDKVSNDWAFFIIDHIGLYGAFDANRYRYGHTLLYSQRVALENALVLLLREGLIVSCGNVYREKK